MYKRQGYDRKILRINLGKRVYKYGRMSASSQLLPIYYVSFEYEFDGDCCFPLNSEPIDDEKYITVKSMFMKKVDNIIAFAREEILNGVNNTMYFSKHVNHQMFDLYKHRFSYANAGWEEKVIENLRIVPKWDGLRGYALYNHGTKELLVICSKGLISIPFSTNVLIQSLIFQVELLQTETKAIVVVEVLKARNTCDYSYNYHKIAHDRAKEYFLNVTEISNDKTFISVQLKESVKFFEILNSKNILSLKLRNTSDISRLLFTSVIKFDKNLIDAKTSQVKLAETFKRFNEYVSKRTDGLIILDIENDIRYKIKFFDTFDCYYLMHEDYTKTRFFSEDKVEVEMHPSFFVSLDRLWHHYKHSTSRPICEILINQETGNLLLFRIREDKYKADGSTKVKLLLTANNISFYCYENVKKRIKKIVLLSK